MANDVCTNTTTLLTSNGYQNERAHIKMKMIVFSSSVFSKLLDFQLKLLIMDLMDFECFRKLKIAINAAGD